ncbi:MAG: NAD(+)/NADH kinase [Eubacteriales bacterium]|nr:NAD(+)/NADH kinase [Eubacteriales bacterium]
MKSIIIFNPKKENANKFLSKLKISLKENNIDFFVVDGKEVSKKDFINIDFIITVGGDGTIINIASKVANLNIPILGINTGHMGFLTQIDKIKDIDKAIEQIKSTKFLLDKRSMLEASVYRKGKLLLKDVALNDIYLSKAGIKKISRYTIYLDNKLFNTYSSDGMIVATPTGSTAYNLSAGGSIIEPNAKVIALTPICVLAFNQRGFIIEDNKIITIITNSDDNLIVYDGKNSLFLLSDDKIIIKKSKSKLNFIKLKDDIFINNLRNKMKSI